MRRRTTGHEWPADLAVCEPERWADEGRPGGDLWMLHAWYRWIDARLAHLVEQGYAYGDAQFFAVGDFPAGLVSRGRA